MSKQVLISADDVTYSLLPGGTGEMTREGQIIDDTIFGDTYKSGMTGPITWGVSANATYKGYPGYVASLLKPGTPTTAAGEACTLVSGKTYQINSTSKRIWDRSVAIVVYDGGVDHTDDVETADFLYGKVTFASTYTVGGAVTVDVTYLPMATLANFTTYTLNQTADAIDNSNIPALAANGGWRTHQAGLKTVTLELPNVFTAADDWHGALTDRDEYVIQINPDGTGLSGSMARGFFRLMSDRQSGNVGALEEETLNFSLNVPLQNTGPASATPFKWFHATNSPIPAAIKKALTAFEDDTLLYVKYLHDGTNGWKGEAVVTNITLSGGMDTANAFTVAVSGSDAPTAVP